MSNNNSLAFKLAVAYLPREVDRHSGKETALSQNILYVYAPSHEVGAVAQVLQRLGIPYVMNYYGSAQHLDKTICFFKRSALTEKQCAYLRQVADLGAQVLPLLDYLEQYQEQVEVDLLHADYFLDGRLSQRAFDKVRAAQKRGLDVFMALLLTVFTAPVWLLAALAIRLESAGPVFFRQRRTGLLNQEFEIIKFRSMRQDAEKDGAQWASQNDSRITRVGRFIRKTRIDELPQLLNVFNGDMSLIGPRPEREVFMADLEQHVPFYRFRHSVKPGITGLAQVEYTYGASIEDAVQKHRYDMYYIKYQSFWLDLKILARTIRIVVTGKGT